MAQHARAQVNDYKGAAGVREQLDETSRVLAGAHGAYVNEAVTSVRWERRGLLKRLVRRPPEQWEQ
jgi:hypothetical protein